MLGLALAFLSSRSGIQQYDKAGWGECAARREALAMGLRSSRKFLRAWVSKQNSTLTSIAKKLRIAGLELLPRLVALNHLRKFYGKFLCRH